MEIELHEVTVRQIFDGYENHGENGVFGYGGKLDIRPPYQRNFIYKDKQRDEVVRTVKKNFPLNIMYWILHDDGTFEVMDGQQRTISICDYVNGDFSVDGHYFHSLSKNFQQAILDYKLMVYFCYGDDDEKLAWFKVVNIAGEKLLDQEIRNATYAEKFVNEARSYFSQRNCAAYRLAKNYVNGDPIRQDFLETALKWIADAQNCSIEDYMSAHKFGDAEELKKYFRDVIAWVKKLFPTKFSEMKGLDWGIFFNRYGKKEIFEVSDRNGGKLQLSVKDLDAHVKNLRDDYDVTSKSGIYKYILTGEEKFLSIRTFDKRTKDLVYKKQGGKCAICGEHFEREQMEADHIVPWSKGGPTIIENCQVLCRDCNLKKSDR